MPLNSFLIRFYNFLERNKLFFIYLPLCVYWVTLFILTTIPIESVPRFFDAQDKIEHLIAYFLLAWLLAFTLHFQRKNKFLSKNYTYITIIFIVFYAAIDEIHQIFIPGRYCDLIDWIADFIGGIFGVLFVKWIINTRIKLFVK